MALKRTAWENMHLLGVDAWALVQLYRPSGSFELSLESGLDGYKALEPYKQWAQQVGTMRFGHGDRAGSGNGEREPFARLCAWKRPCRWTSLFSNDEPVVS